MMSDFDSAEDNEEFGSLEGFRSSDELETSVEDAAAPGPRYVPTCTVPGRFVAASHPTSFQTRTVYHPTFEAYYAAVAALQKQETPQMQSQRERGIIINNGGYFYSDPLQPPGHRVYNFLSPQTYKIFGTFRLVTPPPIMAPGIFVPGPHVLQSSAIQGVSKSTAPKETSGSKESKLLALPVHPPGGVVDDSLKSLEFNSESLGSSEVVGVPASGRSFSDSMCMEESGRSFLGSVCTEESGRSVSESLCTEESGRSFLESMRTEESGRSSLGSVCTEESGRSVSESLCTEESGRSFLESVRTEESGRSLLESMRTQESGRSLLESMRTEESGRSLLESMRTEESGRSLLGSVCTEESGRSLLEYTDFPYTMSELEAVSGLLHLSGRWPFSQ